MTALKRTLVFGRACHLAIKNGQLIYRPREPDAEETIIPIEDIGTVVLEDLSVTLTGHTLCALNEQGAAVILCDAKHRPAAMLVSLEGHTTHAETLRTQIDATPALAKRLWKQTIQAKIKNQALLLNAINSPSGESLLRISEQVKAGDADNREAMAARIYWSRLFKGRDFTRNPEGPPPNGLLNYGYAILRAATARALVSSGLHCAIGIHHCNRYNAFALADDMMEPYRPFVDEAVVLLLQGGTELHVDRKAKKLLLGVITSDVQFNGKRRPLMNALSLTSASLARCISGEERQILYPTIR